ncbi:FAD-dependent oxidoreductase [Parafrigoribacterium mesophilum]|uniref:NAD(P)/FAD-dependent oxidoreductase n=1 Tax=Parafrigoribacterium mesophilum TaxID=433646 RepID=UPI0031FDA6E7
MSQNEKFVIVGAGLAGASAAETLRSEGFDGSIDLIGAEPYRPYIRPPLSKEYLSGKDELEKAFVHPEDWYTKNNVNLRTGTTASSVDAAAHTVTLSDGESIHYDKLLLATGSSPRRLPLPGTDLDGVYYLRTLDDSKALHSILEAGGKRLVLIGSGWIGMEVAATAKTLGNDVTILERDPIPLAVALGDDLGRMFQGVHEEQGVIMRMSLTVASIVGAEGRVAGVRIDGGEVVPADLVLVGIGAVPNVELAKTAGLEVDNGIVTDESLRTSDPDIYAAGDVASAYHPIAKMRLRSEHWANALKGGPVAAKAMLGQSVSYDDIPYFYTDQFDIGMEYSGFGPMTKGAKLVYRGNPESHEFIVFWVADGKVVAGMNVNVWDVNEDVQGIIRRGNTVDPAKLADESVPLGSL